MNTDNYRAWQLLLDQRDKALYMLLGIAIILVGSYLITYVNWIPAKLGKRLRLIYEIGGLALYIGTIIVCLKG